MSITKQMGTEMEQRGAEWVCPNCIKKQQPSIKVSDIRNAKRERVKLTLTLKVVNVNLSSFYFAISKEKTHLPLDHRATHARALYI